MLKSQTPGKTASAAIVQEKPWEAASAAAGQGQTALPPRRLSCAFQDASLYEYPDTISESRPASDELLVLGDLQGNALYLIHALLSHHIIHLPRASYKTIVGMYAAMEAYSEKSKADESAEACPLSIKDLEQLDNIISNITVITRRCHILLIGDVKCDYGHWDDLTGRVLNKLWDEGANVMILLGNHELAHLTEVLTRSREQWDFTESYPSARNTQRLLKAIESARQPQVRSGSFGSLFSKPKATAPKRDPSGFDYPLFLSERFLPNLKCLHAAIADDGQVYLFSHAPVGLEVVVVLANRLGVHLNINTPADLLATVDRINDAYITRVRQRIIKKDPCAFLLGPEEQSPTDYIAADFMGQFMIDYHYDPVLSITQNRPMRNDLATNVYTKDKDGEVQALQDQRSNSVCCTDLDSTRRIFGKIFEGAKPASFTPVPAHMKNYRILNMHGHVGLTLQKMAEGEPVVKMVMTDDPKPEHAFARHQLHANPLHAFLPHCLSTDNGADLVRANIGYLTVSLPFKQQCRATLSVRVISHVIIYWQAQKDLRQLFLRAIDQHPSPIRKLNLSIIKAHHRLINDHCTVLHRSDEQLVEIVRDEKRLGYIPSKALLKIIQDKGIEVIHDMPGLKRRLLNFLIEPTQDISQEAFADQWGSVIDSYCEQFGIKTPLDADTNVFKALESVQPEALLMPAVTTTRAAAQPSSPVSRSHTA